MKKADVCINLVGILFEKGSNNFPNIHEKFPSMISSLCNKHKIDKFIHLAALGIENAKNSKYAIPRITWSVFFSICPFFVINVSKMYKF